MSVLVSFVSDEMPSGLNYSYDYLIFNQSSLCGRSSCMTNAGNHIVRVQPRFVMRLSTTYFEYETFLVGGIRRHNNDAVHFSFQGHDMPVGGPLQARICFDEQDECRIWG
jgi:hypothetical protein